MLLHDKVAVIYGGGGAIGGAVAKAFAREGARVSLADRSADRLEVVAEEIRAAGGTVETAQVDALDERAVDEHAEAVVARLGSLDVSLNVIANPGTFGTPFAEMRLEDYLGPVTTAVKTTFLTARAAARHMTRQRSGVILAVGGSGNPLRGYHIGGTQVAFDAVESMRRQLSEELGGHGVRVVTLRTAGVPETVPDVDGRDAYIENTFIAPSMLGRAATLEDLGHVAAFVASDRARTMTATTANISCGALID